MKLHFFPAELTDKVSALFPSGQEREYVRSVGEGRKVLVFTALSEVPLPFLPRE
jgi:hypothetical protein